MWSPRNHVLRVEARWLVGAIGVAISVAGCNLGGTAVKPTPTPAHRASPAATSSPSPPSQCAALGGVPPGNPPPNFPVAPAVAPAPPPLCAAGGGGRKQCATGAPP